MCVYRPLFRRNRARGGDILHIHGQYELELGLARRWVYPRGFFRLFAFKGTAKSPILYIDISTMEYAGFPYVAGPMSIDIRSRHDVASSGTFPVVLIQQWKEAWPPPRYPSTKIHESDTSVTLASKASKTLFFLFLFLSFYTGPDSYSSSPRIDYDSGAALLITTAASCTTFLKLSCRPARAPTSSVSCGASFS